MGICEVKIDDNHIITGGTAAFRHGGSFPADIESIVDPKCDSDNNQTMFCKVKASSSSPQGNATITFTVDYVDVR
jgi:hypothetical protein